MRRSYEAPGSGLATARRFLAAGARVMLVDLAEPALRAAADALARPDAVATMAADVSRSEDVQRFVQATVARWGAIDVIFSNAGNTGVIAPLADYPEDVFDQVLAVHVRAVSKEAARRRVRVNTVHPGPIDNGFQARIESELSGVLQRDATAFFDGLIPLGRHGRPEEIAEAVLYLASDQSSFVTGSTLMVDGGMST